MTPLAIRKTDINAVQMEETNWYEESVEEAGMEVQCAKGSKSRIRQRMVQIIEAKGLLRAPLLL